MAKFLSRAVPAMDSSDGGGPAENANSNLVKTDWPVFNKGKTRNSIKAN